MKYDFDRIIDRKESGAAKWSPKYLKKLFGEEDILPLWIADMDFECSTPIVEALVKRVQHRIYGYTVITDSYYQSIIDWNIRRNNWEIKKEWIVYTPGVVPALNYMVQAFCYQGDKVIIQSPVYPPFAKAIKNNGCQVLSNKLIFDGTRYVMDYDDLEKKTKDPRTKMLYLCSPHNPVGRVWEEEELTKLGKICRMNNVIVVSDEIHSDLIFESHKHVPFAKISEEFAQNSIICTAPSKTFNIAGFQTSNLIIKNEQIRNQVFNILENNSVRSGTAFGMVALEAAYNEGEEWLEQVLEYIEDNMDFADAYIKEKIPEIKFIKPEGTYLAWLDFSALGLDEIELESWFHDEAKVAPHQGYQFGEGGEQFVRFNLACSRVIIEEALSRVEKAIRGRVV
jgi:cystathionine beta-lyase